jgi:hypothetical protein
MSDSVEAALAQNADTPWRDRCKAALDGCFSELSNAVSRAKPSGDIRFSLIKSNSRSLSLRVETGACHGFLKVFDHPGAVAQRAYAREKQVLLTMRATGLVAHLQAFSDSHRFLLMRYEADRLTQDSLRATGPRQVAQMIGDWTARFDHQAPSEPASGNWFSYLSKFRAGLNPPRIAAAQERLSAIPLCGRGLARNDPALHNFLIGKNGDLMGCDFEKASMRPRGWDYLLMFQALVQRFPEDAAGVLAAYSNGYSTAHRGALIVAELNQIARILFCAQARAGPEAPETG